MKTEKEMREYAIGSAAYWLDCSEHEQTPEDAKILARYARLAINRIVELETALKPFAEIHSYVVENRSHEYMPHQDSNELARWADLCRAAEVLKTERSDVPKPKAEGSTPESSQAEPPKAGDLDLEALEMAECLRKAAFDAPDFSNPQPLNAFTFRKAAIIIERLARRSSKGVDPKGET